MATIEILFALLALLFAACNLNGDNEEISVEDSGINSADTSDSGNTSGDTSDSGSAPTDTSVEDSGNASGDTSADESTPDYFDAETSTYHVYTLEGLLAWASNYSSYSCTLHASIALSDEWTPIGTYSAPYTATFDGGGNTISNLKIESSSDFIGFFGYIGSEGKVANLTLESPNLSGKQDVGAIAGQNNGGSIEGCTVSGGEVSGSTEIGGIVGENTGTVKNCKNSATVSGNDNVGGIVGNSYGTVTGCDNSGGTVSGGTVSGSDYVGGIVGNNYGTVSGCENSGNVSGTGRYVGGIVGSNGGTVSDCKWLKSTAEKGIGGGTDSGTEEYSAEEYS